MGRQKSVGLHRSILDELNSMLMFVAHWYTACRSNCKAFISSSLDISCPIPVSSVKLDMNDVATSLSLSPISIRNIRGPITEPWGTPDKTGLGEDLTPLTTTVWDRLLRKLCSHWPRCPPMPMASSFFRMIPMSSLSNALAKSRYMTSTALPSSRCLVMRSKWASSWLRQEWAARNPCWPALKSRCSSRKLTICFRTTFSKVLIRMDVKATGR